MVCDDADLFVEQRAITSNVLPTLIQKKKLYCAFVDYRKAVDPLKRTMLRTSIDNKILIVNQNLYKNAKCCVRGGSICSLHILELDRVKIYHP